MFLTRIPRSLRQHLEGRFITRLPTSSAAALTRNRIYILPTPFGLGFAVLVLTILLGATNYGNSLAFCLAFLLSGIGLAGMYQSYRNLLNLNIQCLPTSPTFTGRSAAFIFSLGNPTARPRYVVEVGWANDQKKPGKLLDLSNGSENTVTLLIQAYGRGWLQAPALVIQTRFPLAMFRAWCWVRMDQRVLVYPRPVGPYSLPSNTRHGDGTIIRRGQDQDEFIGLRDYQRGDPPSAIHWKSLPKLGRPLVKHFSATHTHILWLDWHALRSLEPELRLCQLCRWVLEAEKSGGEYGLILPDRIISPGHGQMQRTTCLRALALFGKS